MISTEEKDLEIEEIFTADCVKSTKAIHPTLKEVQRKMKGFPEELIFYTYHKLNGRYAEAETYLREWENEQLILQNNLKQLSQSIITADGYH